MIEYSIVIPAYNEEGSIRSTLTQIIGFMKSFSSAYEIIVVDDGSKDKTVSIIEDYARNYPEIKLIKNPHKGKGYTVRTGMLTAQGNYILMSDADMATPIEELKRLLVWIVDHNFDVVIGSREGIGALRKNEPLLRHVMGRVFNLLVQALVVYGINDTQCGFKLFKKAVALDIFSNLVLFGPETKEIKVPRVSAFDVEVLVVAKRRGYTIKEVPIKWTFVKTPRVNPIRDSLANFMDILLVKKNDLLGKYKLIS